MNSQFLKYGTTVKTFGRKKPLKGPELNTHTTLRITIPSAREVLYYGLGIKDEVFNEALEKSWVG